MGRPIAFAGIDAVVHGVSDLKKSRNGISDRHLNRSKALPPTRLKRDAR